ncbi:response regulator [Paucihalobacter ruber]|uniref:histidine kinase n=1 Tax=Paucihalobacter ruber TaxID=2567861 RepID=A0A506PQ15_9FLAO|nr:response regulator [Paucihalobacter ruber]
MSRIKYLIFVIITSFSVLIQAQNLVNEDLELLKLNLENLIVQSELEIDRGDYYNAKESLTKALAISEQLEDLQTQGVLHTKIARIEYTVENSDKAFLSLTKAAEIQREISDYANLAITYNMRGIVHSSKGEYQTALDYFTSAKTKFEEEDLERFLVDVNINEAKVYIKLKNYDEAKERLEQAIILANKYDLQKQLSTALIYNGTVMEKTDNIASAFENTEKGIEIATTNNISKNLMDGYLIMSNLYEKKKDYENANIFIKKHLKLTDSLLNITQDNFSPEKSAQLLKTYNQAERQELISQLSEADSDSNIARLTTILSIGLITILSLLTLSLYKNNNIRLKTNNMLYIKNDELIVAKEKAELASKTKANFLSTVTHELRTPLYAVTGLTNMLLDENPKPEQVQHLKSLKFSGEYLLTFINDILQINKIEANKVELDPEQFNLKNKVENVISALDNSAKTNNTQLHLNYEENLPESFVADQLKISQILINLIGNAIKFTKDGDIWVKISKLNQNNDQYTLRFEIADNGIGISKEKQEHMFESFSQGSIQINRKYGGTGLGLSIVKGLAEILKGKVYVKSELGKGSSFFFEIPLTYAPENVIKKEPNSHAKKIEALDLSNIKILVVEDNKINQMITKKILNKMNLTCDIVENGEDAVEHVKKTNYNVVLMDIHMPGISGIEATKIIRSFDKDLTIFALTAVTLEDKMQEFDEAGFTDIISKPFKQEDFEKKLYNALKKNQSTSQASVEE